MTIMMAAALLAATMAGDAAAETCLPDGGGFLEARLRGAIDADIAWRGDALECTGMSRPDGLGMRLRFAGSLDDGRRLALVFAPRQLLEGEDARAVAVNVTVLDESGDRVFGTRGDGRCTLDQVHQRRAPSGDPSGRVWIVTARGFCTEPARAVAGDGAVLLLRFDFEGRVKHTDPPPPPPGASTS